jgi:hypothetical protein
VVRFGEVRELTRSYPFDLRIDEFRPDAPSRRR